MIFVIFECLWGTLYQDTPGQTQTRTHACGGGGGVGGGRGGRGGGGTGGGRGGDDGGAGAGAVIGAATSYGGISRATFKGIPEGNWGISGPPVIGWSPPGVPPSTP